MDTIKVNSVTNLKVKDLPKGTFVSINLVQEELFGEKVELAYTLSPEKESEDKTYNLTGIEEGEFLAQIDDLKDVVLISDYSKAIYKKFPALIQNHTIISDINLASYVNNGSAKHNLEAQTEFFGYDKKLPAVIRMLLINDNWRNLLTKEAAELWDAENQIARILAFMELEGITINKDKLLELKESYFKEAEQLTKAIRDLLNNPTVNINSNKQLGDALTAAGFKLGRPGKSGSPSIKESVLESLHVTDKLGVIQKILDYRTVQKMYSTYTDSLLVKIDSNNRLHGEYNQTVAATGRLSSANPNLQNIPIRHAKYGSDLRSIFIAKKGYSLISADYSQIELRILAHLTQDPRLLQAFRNDEDIHSVTASEIFGVPLNEVSKKERGVGKTLNFALMYQQGSNATARILGVTPAEGKQYHEKYFEKFAKIKPYVDSELTSAQKTGYAETMYGRRAYYPDLLSTNGFLKTNAQRASFNMPIQGAEADIVKIAMIRLEHDIENAKLDCKLLLQIHDEIVFEVSDDDLDKAKKVIQKAMELDQPLLVPLEVSIHSGKTWNDAK